MEKLKSSVPGLVFLPARNDAVPSGDGYLDGRRRIDGAEGLWRIRNGLYNLNEFMKIHPGGSEWISLTKGTDITELFETHHLSDKAENLLPKFHVRDVTTPRSVPMTFKKDGFYKKFKARATVALKNVNYHKPSLKTIMITDLLAAAAFLFCLLAAATQSPSVILIAGIFFTWTTIAGHNFLHMRDNFRMYYLDISLMSSREWRITHAMSHHMYPNTIWDFEIYAFEPFLPWLPRIKSSITRFGFLYSPVIWFLSFYWQGIRRYVSVFFHHKRMELRDLVPFFLPISMSIVTPDILTAIKVWITIIGISSILFHFIGINAAHHHPKIFHDGDICRDDLDWGLLELDAVRDRKIIDDSHFLVLTNFGSHGLHHLLPFIDHDYLPLCLPAFRETCSEFDVDIEKFTSVELIKGQFKQLARSEPVINIR